MKYPKDKAINEAFQEHGMKVGEQFLVDCNVNSELKCDDVKEKQLLS